MNPTRTLKTLLGLSLLLCGSKALAKDTPKVVTVAYEGCQGFNPTTETTLKSHQRKIQRTLVCIATGKIIETLKKGVPLPSPKMSPDLLNGPFSVPNIAAMAQAPNIVVTTAHGNTSPFVTLMYAADAPLLIQEQQQVRILPANALVATIISVRP